MRISHRAAQVLIVATVIILNIWLLSSGGHNMRYQYDYQVDIEEQP